MWTYINYDTDYVKILLNYLNTIDKCNKILIIESWFYDK